VLTFDPPGLSLVSATARRIAVNIAKLPDLLRDKRRAASAVPWPCDRW
jgi:hypothetical protein